MRTNIQRKGQSKQEEHVRYEIHKQEKREKTRQDKYPFGARGYNFNKEFQTWKVT